MRVIGEIAHPSCKITLFHWNNRYLVKLEHGFFEQTFKIPEYDVTSEEDIRAVVSDDFVREAVTRFESMAASLSAAMRKL